jgi:hypothetical protein
MATGRLGAINLSAATWTGSVAYTCPDTTFSVVTLSICNRGASPITIRVALSTTSGSGTPADAEYLEYDVTLAPKGVLERTGIVMDSTNKYLKVYASAATANAVVMGIETATA